MAQVNLNAPRSETFDLPVKVTGGQEERNLKPQQSQTTTPSLILGISYVDLLASLVSCAFSQLADFMFRTSEFQGQPFGIWHYEQIQKLKASNLPSCLPFPQLSGTGEPQDSSADVRQLAYAAFSQDLI